MPIRIYLLVITVCWLMASGCASLQMERQIITDRSSISGRYNLIQIGGTFGNDAERVVILDIEGDRYSFWPVTGPGRVKTFPGVEGSAALQQAEQFFADHCAYRNYQIRKLTLPGGGIVGYELTPDYPTFLCADGNETLISYVRGDDSQIKVYTRLLLKIGDDRDGKFDTDRIRP